MTIGKALKYILIIIVILSIILSIRSYVGTNVIRKLEEPDRIKICYSGNEIIVEKGHEIYSSILNLNKKRLITPLTVTKINIDDLNSFIPSKNELKLSNEVNRHLLFPIRESNLIELKKNVNTIEYLYDQSHILNYRFTKMYDEPRGSATSIEMEYDKVLFTLTEGKNDLMFFGHDDLVYYHHGHVLKTSSKLSKKFKTEIY